MKTDKSSKKPSYQDAVASVDPALLQSWTQQQLAIRAQVVESDQVPQKPLFVAGADITFSQVLGHFAVASVAVLDANLQLVGLKSRLAKIKTPYVPGFLAFREADLLAEVFRAAEAELQKKFIGSKIDALFVDGNGILHPQKCGLACHLGVALGTPTVGCAKTIFAIDGIDKGCLDQIKERFKQAGEAKGLSEELKGASGKVWGLALKNSKQAFDPLVVSVGHAVSLERAKELVTEFSRSRVVEPVRVADKHSRALVREFEKFHELQDQQKTGKNEDEVAEAFQAKIDAELDPLN